MGFGAAFMGWLVPGGVNDAKYKKDPKKDKVPDCGLLKKAAQDNFAAAKTNPGLFKKFLQVVADAIKNAYIEFMGEIRFSTIVAVKVKKKMQVKALIGTSEKGTSKG